MSFVEAMALTVIGMADEESLSGDDVVVKDNPARDRFEIWVGSELAGFTEYLDRGDHYSFTHTETEQEFEGRGLASRLVRYALDEMRSRGLSVHPYCPFTRSYIERHPEYIELVPESRRRQFHLG
jgi:predicted GNAT family acetyltransferase